MAGISSNLEDRVDDLELLLDVLPTPIRHQLEGLDRLDGVIEVVLDLGAKPEVRFESMGSQRLELPEITTQDIEKVISSVGSFNADNRAGIERTLHRISAIRNRAGKVIGLTCRVGRAVEGTIEIIRDLVESGKSILFLGPPGIGKTTKLRETARVLAVELDKRVVVVDTSNEIAGDGDIPHPGIGRARRMQVPSPDRQHAVMIEAVENHMPEVIIVDEIGTEAEALAARTIAERGVQLVATAHGRTLENLIKNPTLSDLVGGIQSVILGDEEAKFRGTQKTVLERKSAPTFDVLIEIRERDSFTIYMSVADSVDRFLRGDDVTPEVRKRESDGKVKIESEKASSRLRMDSAAPTVQTEVLSIYPVGINVDKLNAAIHSLSVPAQVSMGIHDADLVLTVKSQMRAKSKVTQLMAGRRLPLHVLRRNASTNIAGFLRKYFNLSHDDDDAEDEGLREVEAAIGQVSAEGKPVDLAPQNAYIRRLQHQAIQAANLNSMSIGKDPNRRVRIYPLAS